MKNQFVLLQTNRFRQFTLCFFLLSVFLGAAPAPQKMSITPMFQDTVVAEVVGPEPDVQADEGEGVIALIASIASLVLVAAGGILLFAVSTFNPVVAIVMLVIGLVLSLTVIGIDRSLTKEARLFRKAEKARAPEIKPPKIKRSRRMKIALVLASLSIFSTLGIALAVGMIILWVLMIIFMLEELGCL